MTWTTRLTKPVLWIVSFVLSMTLYLFVQSQTPANQKESVDLEVKAVHLDPAFILVGEDTTVKFDVTGPQGSLNRLLQAARESRPRVYATVDLKDVRGPTTRPFVPKLEIEPSQDYPDLTFTPTSRFQAVIERLKEATAPITVSLPAKWKDKYDPGDFEVKPSTVTLRGAESEVRDAVPTVTIEDPEQVEQEGQFSATVAVVDGKSKGTLNNLLPQSMDRVDVHPVRRQRDAYVNVNFVGHIPTGFRIANYYVVTQNGPGSTTRIRGPGGLVDKTASIDVQVDISALTKGYTFTVQPKNLSPRIELMDAPLKIRVDIEKPHQ